MIQVLSFINNGIFPGHVLFSCGYKFDVLYSKLKKICTNKNKYWYQAIHDDKKLLDSGNYFALSRTLENVKTGEIKELYYIIITTDFLFTDYEYCKLAHECLHICQFFLPKILDRNREIEAEAYYHTHLMEHCLKEIRKVI